MTHPPAEFSGQEFSKLTTWLEPLTAVVLMLVSKDATLLHANKGGRRILEQIAPAGSRSDGVREFFVHPTLAELLAIDVSPGQAIFQGVINVGNSLAYCRSLSGAVFRDGDQLLLIGEYDIADMESMSSTVIELNGLLVSTQRELYRSNRKLQESEANLIALSRTDPLTGVANRRRLMEFLQLEIDRFGRHAHPFSVTMTDVDHFKRINDEFGHAVGDAALKAFAVLLQDSMRAVDLVARVGGEEFVIVMPETSLQGAIEKSERLRAAVEQLQIKNLRGTVTASFGVEEFNQSMDAETILRHVDEAVYASKHGGRNRVTAFLAPGAAADVSRVKAGGD